MSRVLHWVGLAWLVLAGSSVILGAAGIIYFRGFAAFQDVFSPFNAINYLLIFALLAPGLALLHWSERLAKRRDRGPA
jgi:hypothetical protein